LISLLSPLYVSVSTVSGGRVSIEVADRGPGIHPDDLERIFEKLGRGRNGKDGQVSGAGLGLYLSRRIVRAHGSDLTVRSRPGAGSVFAFELKKGDRENHEW
jgi:signal transduction histidine kinase